MAEYVGDIYDSEYEFEQNDEIQYVRTLFKYHYVNMNDIYGPYSFYRSYGSLGYVMTKKSNLCLKKRDFGF